MTNSELIDDNSNFAVLIRSSKLVSVHLFHGIRGARLQQGHSAGAQATIYCCGNIQRDRNPPHSFVHSNAPRSCGAASVDPADVFHHSEPRIRELRFSLVELSLLTFRVRVPQKKTKHTGVFTPNRLIVSTV